MESTGFGEKLRKLRINKGMTQQDLADRLGLTKAVVSTYEQGIHMPSLVTLTQIAQLFEVTTDYLLSVGDEHLRERTGDFAGDDDGVDTEKVKRLSERLMGIGKQIRELREERGLSRQELASGLKLSTMAIGKYERDIMAPSYGTLMDMARFFNVSTEKLLGIETGRIVDISELSDDKRELVRDLVRGMR